MPTKSDFNFNPDLPKRIQRGWERAPKSPRAARRRGRKVWKRPDFRITIEHEETADPNPNGGRHPLSGLPTNISRPVKKLRVKDALESPADAASNTSVPYVTTLRDGNLGTPRRKDAQAQRNRHLSDGSDLIHGQKAQKTTMENPLTFPRRLAVDLTRGCFVSSDTKPGDHVPSVIAEPLIKDKTTAPLMCVSAAEEVEQHCEGASAAVREMVLPAIENVVPDEISDPPGAHMFQISSPRKADIIEAASFNLSGRYLNEEAASIACQRGEPSGSFNSTDRNALGSPSSCNRTRDSSHAPTLTQAQHLDTQECGLSLAQVTTPKHITVDTPHKTHNAPEVESPQIGTTLLRRESLRRKESPRSKETRKGRSPHIRQLKKRDTLQEREILQKFSETRSPDQEGEGADVALSAVPHLLDHVTESSKRKWSAPVDAEPVVEDDVRTGLGDGEVISDSKGLREALSTSKLCGGVGSVNQFPVSPADLAKFALLAVDVQPSTGFDLETRVGDAQQTVEGVSEQVDLDIRNGRLSARYSDDTSILKDFLNRAQARRAAREAIDGPKSLQRSPRRSPRKALQVLNEATSSSVQLEELTPGRVPTRPATPTATSKIDFPAADDVGGPAVEAPSCRRSARTRLPARSKPPPGAPSLIPVRRADGTDPVVLQKSQAQELAIVTRTNTRRNKGQSKPPLLALQDLPVEDSGCLTTVKQGAGHAKTVVWADKLTRYHDTNHATEEAEDQRPKVRRLRGLGTRNGASMAEGTAAVVPLAADGTRAPKRRSKSSMNRGKGKMM
ncbi:MAG: hypothetical protein Q9163_004268 [Psora crenata]